MRALTPFARRRATADSELGMKSNRVGSEADFPPSRIVGGNERRRWAKPPIGTNGCGSASGPKKRIQHGDIRRRPESNRALTPLGASGTSDPLFFQSS